ncbi:MAG: YedE family putative selenium transporter, partial [Candidatus Cloacimonetes bacterium]|nr:YedE family putative selenium transporter [Candidatus Cloacimonadota bacterium]
MKNYLSTRLGIILVGAFIGVVAVLLQYFGNPPNMGICVACFERDIAGSLGFHAAKVVQYLRPEIIGLLVGAFFVSFLKKEFRPRGGSSTLIRFFLGIFAMIGALVFLGCPWRTILRIAGGDLNGIVGLLGLIFGVFLGVVFLKKGYNLGRSQSLKSPAAGYLMPGLMLALLLLQLIGFSKLQTSVDGPGSMQAPLIISLVVGLIIGVIAQRSRFCTMGS